MADFGQTYLTCLFVIEVNVQKWHTSALTQFKQEVFYAWHWTVCCWWIRCIMLTYMHKHCHCTKCIPMIYIVLFWCSIKCQGYNSTTLKSSVFFLIRQAHLWNTGKPQLSLCLQTHRLPVSRLHCGLIFEMSFKRLMTALNVTKRCHCKHLIIFPASWFRRMCFNLCNQFFCVCLQMFLKDKKSFKAKFNQCTMTKYILCIYVL